MSSTWTLHSNGSHFQTTINKKRNIKQKIFSPLNISRILHFIGFISRFVFLADVHWKSVRDKRWPKLDLSICPVINIHQIHLSRRKQKHKCRAAYKSDITIYSVYLFYFHIDLLCLIYILRMVQQSVSIFCSC